jgi:predicted metalloprotease with PDZ domain
MRTVTWCLAWSLSVVVAPAAMAQDRGLAIEYTVKVADIPGQLFHVTTDINNINQPALDLSLPVWSPGWYVIENYAKNVFRFRVTEPGGRELRPAQVRKQTWRIDTSGISRVTVEFDYLANVLSANQARIAADYAFFTGTQLFLLPEGHRSRPSRVRFDVPSGWKIASGLDETAAPMVFTAPEYDTLVDQPTLMGRFDVTRFTVDGKPHGRLGTGEYFGELSLVDGLPRSAEVRAGPDGLSTFAITKWTFADLIEDHPEVAVPMLHVMVARLRAAEAADREG